MNLRLKRAFCNRPDPSFPKKLWGTKYIRRYPTAEDAAAFWMSRLRVAPRKKNIGQAEMLLTKEKEEALKVNGQVYPRSGLLAII